MYIRVYFCIISGYGYRLPRHNNPSRASRVHCTLCSGAFVKCSLALFSFLFCAQFIQLLTRNHNHSVQRTACHNRAIRNPTHK